jgi:tape measure domain-containing protein
MAARLKLATAGQREFSVAQKELFAIAQRIGVPLQETATLYGKLQKAVRGLGLEQQDALALTESISQALQISGASTAEAQAALLQFGQALAAGVLRGEEFNSVVENSPRLAQALADGLNVPIGRLRKLAEEGRLTADVVVQALMSSVTRRGGRADGRNKGAKSLVPWGAAAAKTDLSLVRTCPTISLVLGDVGPIGEPFGHPV